MSKRKYPLWVLLIGGVICAALFLEIERSEHIRPNILLITIDTLRADHLEIYGYPQATAPRLARLANAGIRFEHAIATAPWTLASMASVHTALYPSQHGAVGADTRIPEELTTLAEELSAQGYRTSAVIPHTFVDAEHGFGQGFDFFDETQILGHDAVTSEAITGIALTQLESDSDQPLFLWVHYFDPHFTYVHHPDIGFVEPSEPEFPPRITADMLHKPKDRDAAMVSHVKGLYDEEIRFTDDSIGRLIDGVETSLGSSETVILVTADHGEYFMERGRFFHGKDVYDELIRVPLVIGGSVPAELRGSVVETSVDLTNIPATVMSLIGQDQHQFRGQDLLAIARGELTAAPAFAEGCYAFGTDLRKRAVIFDGWKLIEHLENNRRELYDLRADPAERTNLYRSKAPETEEPRSALRALMDDFPAGQWENSSPTLELSPEERDHLEALGYLQSN